jgi:VanZ family protein
MRKGAHVAGWALVIMVTALSLVSPAWRPNTGIAHNLEHFAVFALTGFAFSLAYDRSLRVVLAGLVIFAGLIEFAQLFAPGRHARLSDFIVDALAGCAGAVLASLAMRTAEHQN